MAGQLHVATPVMPWVKLACYAKVYEYYTNSARQQFPQELITVAITEHPATAVKRPIGQLGLRRVDCLH